MSYPESLITQWPYARLLNKNNEETEVNLQVIRQVTEQTPWSPDNDVPGVLIDSDAPDAYPILGYSYLLLHQTGMRDCESAVELFRYIEWCIYDDYAEEVSSELGLVRVIPSVADFIYSEVLEELYCDDHKHVRDLVEQQKHLENDISLFWKIPVAIAVPTTMVLLGILICYIIYQKYRLKKAVLTDEWIIPNQDISLRWDKDEGRIRSQQLTPSKRKKQMSRINSMTDYKYSTGTCFSISDNSNMWPAQVAKIGIWFGKAVTLRSTIDKGVSLTKRSTKLTVLNMRYKVVHQNVLRFYGVTYYGLDMYFVSEHASKGSLTDILQNDKYKLDSNFKFSIAIDICRGMDFLHNQNIIHGGLNSNSCLLDGKWNVKVSDWEYFTLNKVHKSRSKMSVKTRTKISSVVHNGISVNIIPDAVDRNIEARKSFWIAPELLKREVAEANKKTDVYSFGLLLHEIFLRQDPYMEYTDTMEPTQVIQSYQR